MMDRVPFSEMGEIGRQTVEIKSSILSVLYVPGLESPPLCNQYTIKLSPEWEIRRGPSETFGNLGE